MKIGNKVKVIKLLNNSGIKITPPPDIVGKITKYTEWVGNIAGHEVKIFHGLIYINDRELNFMDEFENSLNNIIIELIKKIY